jgi:hypothetical protein
MKSRLAGTIFSAGLAALLAGTLAAVPAAASTTGLHVVASPVINNSALGGAAVIAPGDMWAVGSVVLGQLHKRGAQCLYGSKAKGGTHEKAS